MQLVHSKQEIDDIRPYPNYDFLQYPKSYPAFIEFESCDGGISGDYYITKILEIPEGVNADSFLRGFLAEPESHYETTAFGKRK